MNNITVKDLKKALTIFVVSINANSLKLTKIQHDKLTQLIRLYNDKTYTIDAAKALHSFISNESLMLNKKWMNYIKLHMQYVVHDMYSKHNQYIKLDAKSAEQAIIRNVVDTITRNKICCRICGDKDKLNEIQLTTGECILLCSDCLKIQNNM